MPVRIRDWKEVYEEQPVTELPAPGRPLHGLRDPVLPQGCPLGNLIPEWNDLAWRGSGARPSTGCTRRTTSPSSPAGSARRPASRRASSGINQPAVTIKQVEVSIIDRAFANGTVTPEAPERLSGKTVAVVGSGPGRARRPHSS